jgi:hypothetical protein
MIDYKRAKLDEIYFFNKILKIDLDDNQKKVILDKSKRKLLRCGRRWAKTYLAAGHCLFLALNKIKIGVYGPGWEEVDVAMDMIREHIMNAGLEGSISINKKFELGFTSGARIIARIASKLARGKRGRGFDHLWVDEAAFIGDAEMAVLRPTTLDHSASEWLTTTPSGHNHIYKAELSGIYSNFHFTTYDNKRILKKDIDKEKELISELEFRQEILAEYLDDALQPIPTELIEKAINNDLPFINDPEPGHHYVAGLDLGRKRDRSVFLILDCLKNSHARIAHIKSFNYSPTDPRFWVKVLDHAEYLCQHFNLTDLYPDATAIGDKPVQDLILSLAKKNIQTKVHPVNFTYAVKNKWEGLINQLCIVFERYKLHFPFHMELVKQLKSIRFDSRSSLFSNVGKSPDIVMALALAVKGIKNSSDCFYSVGNRRAIDSRSKSITTY